MDNNEQLLATLARGFEGINAQLKEGDGKVARLREDMIRVEGDLKSITATLNRLDGEMSRSENEGLKIKVANLESAIKDLRDKQEANALWLRGLLISVIFLLIGFLFNFITLRLR